jgi:hypothetical protein
MSLGLAKKHIIALALAVIFILFHSPIIMAGLTIFIIALLIIIGLISNHCPCHCD